MKLGSKLSYFLSIRQKTSRKKFTRTPITVLLFTYIFLILVIILAPLVIASDQEWEELNYYQILGLLPEDYYQPSSTGNTSASSESNQQWSLKSRRQRIKERNQFGERDIKKGYRKQAQAWHPDKVTSRKRQQEKNSTNVEMNKNNSTGSIDYSNMSIEDCNKRFVKISEAYETLRDDAKRREYDQYLLNAEDDMQRERKRKARSTQRNEYERANRKGRSSSSYSHSSSDVSNPEQQQSPSSIFTDFFSDPMSVFEEFFFGTSDKRGASDFMDDVFEKFYNGGKSKQNDNQQQQQNYNGRSQGRKRSHGSFHDRQPDRTFASETVEKKYDPRYRTEVVKVLQREEFDQPEMGKIYFRVMAQEFIEEFDPYGRSLGYTPISEPYIMEDGYKPMKKTRKEKKKSSSGRKRQDELRRPLRTKSHRLEKNQYITLKTEHLHSKNEKYYAGLTEECELIIVRNEGPDREDTLVWRSNTYVPPRHRRGCALAMYGPRIAIIVGDVENPSTIMWNSPPPPPLTPGYNDDDEEELIDYYCSLDDDGNLAVYRTRESINISSVTKGDLLSIAEMWLSDLVRGEDHFHHYDTHAAEKWRVIRQWATLKTKAKPTDLKEWASKFDSKVRNGQHRNKNVKEVDECVYATGPAGCLTPGRHFIQISKNIQNSIGKAAAKVDDTVVGFVDYIYEGSEDDLDVLDTVNRILSKLYHKVIMSITSIYPEIIGMINMAKEKIIQLFLLLEASFTQAWPGLSPIFENVRDKCAFLNQTEIRNSFRRLGEKYRAFHRKDVDARDLSQQILYKLKKWSKIIRYEAVDYASSGRDRIQKLSRIVKEKADGLFEKVAGDFKL